MEALVVEHCPTADDSKLSDTGAKRSLFAADG